MSVWPRGRRQHAGCPADPSRPGPDAAPNFELPPRRAAGAAVRGAHPRRAHGGAGGRRRAAWRARCRWPAFADELDALAAFATRNCTCASKAPLGCGVDRFCAASLRRPPPPPRRRTRGRAPRPPLRAGSRRHPVDSTIRFDGHRCIHARALHAWRHRTPFVAKKKQARARALAAPGDPSTSSRRGRRRPQLSVRAAITYERHDGGPQGRRRRSTSCACARTAPMPGRRDDRTARRRLVSAPRCALRQVEAQALLRRPQPTPSAGFVPPGETARSAPSR